MKLALFAAMSVLSTSVLSHNFDALSPGQGPVSSELPRPITKPLNFKLCHMARHDQHAAFYYQLQLNGLKSEMMLAHLRCKGKRLNEYLDSNQAMRLKSRLNRDAART